MKKMWVYIAGPYTNGDVAENVRRALIVAEHVRSAGYVPIIPHLSHFWHLIHHHPYGFWTDLDLDLMERCDAMIRIAGDSPGADQEEATWRVWGRPIEVIEGVSWTKVVDATDRLYQGLFGTEVRIR